MKEDKSYNCKYHEWGYWIQYGCKMWEGHCTKKDCDCKGECEMFAPTVIEKEVQK